MTEQLQQYYLFMTQAIAGLHESTNKTYIRYLLELHTLQVNAFQHERFIHLLVTFFFGTLLLTCIVLTAVWPVWQWLTLDFIMLILLGFYIKHYYYLENTIHKLYPMTQTLMHYLDMEIPAISLEK